MLSEPGTQAMDVSFNKLTSSQTHPCCQMGKPQTAPRAEEIQAHVCYRCTYQTQRCSNKHLQLSFSRRGDACQVWGNSASLLDLLQLQGNRCNTTPTGLQKQLKTIMLATFFLKCWEFRLQCSRLGNITIFLQSGVLNIWKRDFQMHFTSCVHYH